LILILDNYDSFTYNLLDYFHQLGADCKVFRNDVHIDTIFNNPITGVVVSPGPENPSKAGNLNAVIAYAHNKFPILGICLGHQGIGEYFGARLVKASKPMHGKISEIRLEKDPIFEGIHKMVKVVRYHSLILQEVTGDLKTIASTNDGEIMAIRHRTFPIWGLQYHPEAILSEGGLKVLENWLRINHLT